MSKIYSHCSCTAFHIWTRIVFSQLLSRKIFLLLEILVMTIIILNFHNSKRKDHIHNYCNTIKLLVRVALEGWVAGPRNPCCFPTVLFSLEKRPLWETSFCSGDIVISWAQCFLFLHHHLWMLQPLSCTNSLFTSSSLESTVQHGDYCMEEW